MPEEKGSGKHPHKSTEEPWSHHKEASGKKEEEKQQSRQSGAKESGAKEEQASSGSEESSDLKEREYRDKEGNIHHHTRTSEEMKERKAS
jgi:hypothetical protein